MSHPQANLLTIARIRFTKWLGRILPDTLVYRILIRGSTIARQPVFQAAFAASDPAKTALDIGANRGIVSYALSLKFASVHCFEPNMELGRFLTRVLPSNCTLHRCGLSDRTGGGLFATGMEGGVAIHGRGHVLQDSGNDADPRAVQEIRLETLDSLGLANVGFIKIDVEGHEEKVIRGGLETLRTNRPVLVIEIESRHTGKPAGETIAMIESLGYHGFFFEEGRQRPVAEFTEAMQQPHYPRYINDFLFLPK